MHKAKLSSSRHLPILDLLRIVASLSVVHHHMRKSLLFGVGLGLPLFLVLFFALSVKSTKRESIKHKLGRKSRDLLVPWVRWSLIYFALLVFSDYARGLDPLGRVDVSMVLIGGNAALWFLPFAALALVIAEAIRWVAKPMRPDQSIVFLIALAVVATHIDSIVLHRPLGDPYVNWIRALPAIPWGLAIGMGQQACAGRKNERPFLLISLASFATFLLLPPETHPNDIARRMAIAVALTCVGFTWRPRLPIAIKHIATLSFGVYLVHPFVGKALHEVTDVFSWSAFTHGNLAWAISLSGVYAMRRIGLKWRELRPKVSLPGCT